MVLFAMGLIASAQDGSGSCKLPGTYDYVNVDYYKDGHLVVSNQSGVKLTQLHIRVTCTDTWFANNGTQKKTATVVLCDKNFYDILPNQSTSLTDGVKSGMESRYKASGGKLSDFKVEVGNPMCGKME